MRISHDHDRLQPDDHPIDTHDAGDLAERLELLKLRDSDDPVARAIALLGSQLLRRLDGIAEGPEARS